ncbi:MAG: MFS transporter [Candidatus Aminicenantes bacterium]|nr:MFS transporter [Candidatus Aminicenantes bacterium]
MSRTARIHLLNFVRKMAVTTVFFLAPLEFLRLGFRPVEIGLVVALLAGAPLLFSFPWGWVNDRFSIRRVVLFGVGATSVLFLLFLTVRGVWPTALVFLLLGVANNAADVSLNSLYFKDESDRNLNRKYGVYLFWLSAGPMAGLLLGGLLALVGNFRTMLVVFAGLMALTLLALIRFDGETFAAVTLKDYRASLIRPRTVLFAVLLFVLAMHWGVEGTVYAPFLRARFGLNDVQLPLFMGVSYAGLTAMALLVSRWRYDPRASRGIFLIGMTLSGFGHILMVQKSVWISLGFRFLHEAGDGLLGAMVLLYIARLFERRSIGGSAGLLLAVQTTGQMTGALLFSSLGGRFGLQAPFIVSGLLLLANAIYGSFVIPVEAGPETTAAPVRAAP